MPLTTLDPHCALIVIDLQHGIVSLPTAPLAAVDVTAHSVQLVQAFRRQGLPVVLVNVTGAAPGRTDAPPRSSPPAADWALLVEALDPQPSDILISKQGWGAFSQTTLDAELRARGVTQVVFTGIATSIGIESSARSAHGLGYHVVFVLDAMADLNAESHQHSVSKIFPRLGESTTTAALLTRLEQPR
jgi:nicotinamidase-related amidase